MENNVLEYLLKCIRILQIENAKLQYEYDYLLEYIEEDNKYFNEDDYEEHTNMEELAEYISGSTFSS